MIERNASVMAAVSVLLSCGCVSMGPVVPIPPTVRVAELESLVISPDAVKYQAKVVIENRMGAGLNLEKVVYGADVHDQPAFNETFTQLRPMRRHGRQTVTFPFQIGMTDIAAQAVDVLAEEGLRVTFRGHVFPVGFDPIPFEMTRVIPVPLVPIVTIDGAEGSPLEGVFTVYLRVANKNRFPMNLHNMDTFLELNGKRYGLLQVQGGADLGPGGSGRIALRMEQSIGKGLSMILNVAQQRSTRFAIGGSMSYQTPYGLLHLPLALTGGA